MPRSRFPQRALVHQLRYVTAMRSRPIASGVSLGLAALAIVGTGRCGAGGGPRPPLDGRGRWDSGICPLVRVELMLGRRLTPGPRSGGCRMTRAGQQAVRREPERQQECRQDRHRQRLRLVRPVPPARCGRCARHDGCGRGVVEDVGECQRLRYLAGGVEPPDQRLRGGPGRLGYGADVAPRVKVAAACGVVVVLDVADECFPDAGPLADLGNGKASLVACLCQCLADAHAAPPHMYRTARRPDHRVPMVRAPSPGPQMLHLRVLPPREPDSGRPDPSGRRFIVPGHRARPAIAQVNDCGDPTATRQAGPSRLGRPAVLAGPVAVAVRVHRRRPGPPSGSPPRPPPHFDLRARRHRPAPGGP